MYWREQSLQRFYRKLDSEDGEEQSERGHIGDQLERGEGPGTINGVTWPGAWALQGAPMGIRGKRDLLDTLAKIPKSLVGICISILIKLLHFNLWGCVLYIHIHIHIRDGYFREPSLWHKDITYAPKRWTVYAIFNLRESPLTTRSLISRIRANFS
jgi:hypothetical protein